MTYNMVRQGLPELIIIFLIGFTIGTIIYFFGKPIDPASALSFLSTIAEISATILSIFSAAALFACMHDILRRKGLHDDRQKKCIIPIQSSKRRRLSWADHFKSQSQD